MEDNPLEGFVRLCSGVPEFGDALKDIRANNNLTAKYVADRLHIGLAAYYRWEDNIIPQYFTVSHIEQIGNALNLSDLEYSLLITSFVCYELRRRGL